MDKNIRVTVESRFPLFMEVNPDSFGEFFASLADDDQVAVLRAMVHHMKPHQTQWDYISIELEKPENCDLRQILREVLFPDGAS